MFNKFLFVFIFLGVLSAKAQDFIGEIEQLDSDMALLVSKESKIEVLANGFSWAEGPVWVPKLNGLLFTDVPKNKAYLWTERQGISLFLNPSGMTNHAPNNKSAGSNGLGLDSDGNLILCQHGDRSISRLNNWFFEEPKYDVLVDHFNGKWLNSPNDLVFDIETMFLLPWSLAISKLNLLGFWAMVDFIIELGVGFVYVLYMNALDWE